MWQRYVFFPKYDYVCSMNIDELYMRRCLQLAAMAQGHTSPNPMVGAVVVCDGRIIGEGYHRCCGEAHAEVNAINSVADKSLLTRSTIYVSLEPCSHYGKTPPCCDLIIKCGIPRVVVGCLDPFPQVCGRGVGKLREHGISVAINVLEEECKALNRKFITFQQKGRPYITLKWAQSHDGYIDRMRRSDEPPTQFSTAITRVWSHRLRATNDAIIVGTNTVIKDNPSLTTRYWAGRNPLRITIDRKGRIPAGAAMLDGTTDTLILGQNRCADKVRAIPLQPHQSSIETLLKELFARNIQSLIVEGGTQLLQSFIDSNLWDEARIETTPIQLCRGVKAPTIQGMEIEQTRHNIHHHTRILKNTPR